jgi:hypothetical protein
MEPENNHYFSYLLRIWLNTSTSRWRASLDNPHTGEKLTFPNLEQLCSFLDDECTEKRHERRGRPGSDPNEEKTSIFDDQD